MTDDQDFSGTQIRDIFAKNLKALRKKEGLSQLVLANKAGLTHTFINDIEHCKKWVSCKTIARLCNALHAKPYQLFLPLSKEKRPHSETLSAYIDDLPLLLQQTLDDFKNRYLPD